jgi:peptidoglycan/xylan/chitin deacetylase (PgdA/CDA1 family)
MHVFLQRWLPALFPTGMGTITRFRTREPLAALTFDDGPDLETTPRVLELLESHGARATFFMVGEAAARHSGLLQTMARKGHEIANHTWSHRSVAVLSRTERRKQIVNCARAIAPHGQPLFRPPWGEQTIASRFDTFLLRHDVAAWNLDVGDWWNPDAEDMAGELETKIRPGSIVLLHDAIRSEPAAEGATPVLFSRESMLQALQLFLHRLGGRIRFVTIGEMLKHGTAVRRACFQSPSSFTHHSAVGI